MARVVFIAAHAGYPASVPLGGGAVIADRLIREWAPRLGEELLVLGAGPRPPAEGIRYVRLPPGREPELTRLSVSAYARFCREFAETALARLRAEAPNKPAVFLNDISEAPEAGRAAGNASRVVSLWHVDVADYIGRVSLRSETAARWAPSVYERLRRAGLARLLPSVLGLIFEKQRAIAAHADALVLPSAEMRRRLIQAYGAIAPGLEDRIHVMPWGTWDESFSAKDVLLEKDALARECGVRSGDFVMVTLSRISPEKGLDLLLKAVASLEAGGARLPERSHLFICGEAAFMWGESYLSTLKRLAARLSRVRVHFLGQVQGARKRAALESAALFVSPSLHESYGLAIQEGLRAGLPVVASDSFGAREILGDGAGTLASYAEGGGVAALSRALRPLLEDPRRLAPMREAVLRRPAGPAFQDTARRLLELGLN